MIKYTPLLVALTIALSAGFLPAQNQPRSAGSYPVIFGQVQFEYTKGIMLWRGKTDEECRADYDAQLARVMAVIDPVKTIDINTPILGGRYLTSYEELSDWAESGAGKIFKAVYDDKNGEAIAVVTFAGWSDTFISGKTSFYLSHQLVSLLKHRRVPLIYVCPWNAPSAVNHKYEVELVMSIPGSKIIGPGALKDTLSKIAADRISNPPDLAWEPEPMTPPRPPVPPMPEGMPERGPVDKVVPILKFYTSGSRFPSTYAPKGAPTPHPEGYQIVEEFDKGPRPRPQITPDNTVYPESMKPYGRPTIID